MFGKKPVVPAIVPDSGFTATLKLPRYFPKEKIIGKVAFDNELERVGQAIDWTYTPSGYISLIVSGRTLREMLKEGDSILVPFEYIDRVGNFILLSKALDALVPKGVAIGKEELMEKVAIEKTLQSKITPFVSLSDKKKKKGEKELKSINELGKEVLENLIPQNGDNGEKKPAPEKRAAPEKKLAPKKKVAPKKKAASKKKPASRKKPAPKKAR